MLVSWSANFPPSERDVYDMWVSTIEFNWFFCVRQQTCCSVIG